MSDATIEDIYVKPEDPAKLFGRLKHLRGDEYEAMLKAGISGMTDDPIRLAFALGWLELRRRHPGLSYEDGCQHVLLDFSGAFEAEAVDLGPTEAPDPT